MPRFVYVMMLIQYYSRKWIVCHPFSANLEGLCSIFGGFSTGNDRVYKDLLQGFLNNQTDLVTFLLV